MNLIQFQLNFNEFIEFLWNFNEFIEILINFIELLFNFNVAVNIIGRLMNDMSVKQDNNHQGGALPLFSRSPPLQSGHFICF